MKCSLESGLAGSGWDGVSEACVGTGSSVSSGGEDAGCVALDALADGAVLGASAGISIASMSSMTSCGAVGDCAVARTGGTGEADTAGSETGGITSLLSMELISIVTVPVKGSGRSDASQINAGESFNSVKL